MPRIVVMKDRAPLIVKKKEIEGDDVWVCRCGLSADWPWCDDTHLKIKGEPRDKLFKYTRQKPEDDPHRSDAGAVEGADPRPWDPGNRKA
jgi:CDGSH-type Zn-finger protein